MPSLLRTLATAPTVSGLGRQWPDPVYGPVARRVARPVDRIVLWPRELPLMRRAIRPVLAGRRDWFDGSVATDNVIYVKSEVGESIHDSSGFT